MKQLNPILKFIFHFSLWLIPAFILWLVSVNSIILPGLRIVVGEISGFWFHKEQVELHEAKGDRWLVRTNLLTMQQPKNSTQHSRWIVFVNPLLIYTVGFPILWAWFLATPHRRIFNQIVGNSIIFLLTAIVLWLLVFHSVAMITANGGAEYVYSHGYISPAPIYSKWMLSSIAHIQLLLAYFACGLAVPILWYGFNRDFVKKLISKYGEQKH